MADINPLETTLQSTTGKIAIGVGVLTLIASVTIPFLPDVQRQLAAKDYMGLLSTVVLLVSANISAIKLHGDSTKKKVAMISATSLPMSSDSKYSV